MHWIIRSVAEDAQVNQHTTWSAAPSNLLHSGRRQWIQPTVSAFGVQCPFNCSLGTATIWL